MSRTARRSVPSESPIVADADHISDSQLGNHLGNQFASLSGAVTIGLGKGTPVEFQGIYRRRDKFDRHYFEIPMDTYTTLSSQYGTDEDNVAAFYIDHYWKDVPHARGKLAKGLVEANIFTDATKQGYICKIVGEMHTMAQGSRIKGKRYEGYFLVVKKVLPLAPNLQPKSEEAIAARKAIREYWISKDDPEQQGTKRGSGSRKKAAAAPPKRTRKALIQPPADDEQSQALAADDDDNEVDLDEYGQA
jgi:hypothetical protein